MNKKIKQLANKALKHPDTDNDGLTVFDNNELEKFAELIIHECIDIVENQGRFLRYDVLAKKIKENFEIKNER